LFYITSMEITVHRRPLGDVSETGAEMARLVRLYWRDLGKFLKLPFGKFFDYVRRLPYIADPETVETISRPAHSLRLGHAPRDCDDKAVLIGSWLYAHGIPFRFVAVGRFAGRPLHHTFATALLFGKEVAIDATYGHNFLGQVQTYERKIFISPIIKRLKHG